MNDRTGTNAEFQLAGTENPSRVDEHAGRVDRAGFGFASIRPDGDTETARVMRADTNGRTSAPLELHRVSTVLTGETPREVER